jgi:hypothetical protein
MEEVRCVAAPIRDQAGTVVASIGISAPATRFPKSRWSLAARQVMDTARAISATLGAYFAAALACGRGLHTTTPLTHSRAEHDSAITHCTIRTRPGRAADDPPGSRGAPAGSTESLSMMPDLASSAIAPAARLVRARHAALVACTGVAVVGALLAQAPERRPARAGAAKASSQWRTTAAGPTPRSSSTSRRSRRRTSPP